MKFNMRRILTAVANSYADTGNINECDKAAAAVQMQIRSARTHRVLSQKLWGFSIVVKDTTCKHHYQYKKLLSL